MFGPNTHVTSKLSLNYSHRDREFFNLYKEVDSLFKSTFNLNDYHLLFLPGSGTIGIEAVFRSCTSIIKLIGNEGKFKSRWNELSDTYLAYGPETIEMFCQLETSNSSIFSKEGCVVDAISSFPFYDLPNNTKIFITCSNKLIGSYPGLSIVGIHKDHTDLIESDVEFSYLSLSNYLNYSFKSQLPTTAPVHLFKHLKKILQDFDLEALRSKVVENSSKLVNVLGSDKIIGEKTCPVISIPKEYIPDKLAQKYQLYGINSNSEYYQIFTYSNSNDIFNNFINELKKS